MKPKFDVGDKIQNAGEVSEVLSYTVSKDGIVYRVSSKDFDLITKVVTPGVKTLNEEELEAFVEPEIEEEVTEEIEEVPEGGSGEPELVEDSNE